MAFRFRAARRFCSTANSLPTASKSSQSPFSSILRYGTAGAFVGGVSLLAWKFEDVSDYFYRQSVKAFVNYCQHDGASDYMKATTLKYGLYPLVMQRGPETLDIAGELGIVEAALKAADMGDLENVRSAAYVLEEALRSARNRKEHSRDKETLGRFIGWAKSSDEALAASAMGILLFLLLDDDVKPDLIDVGVLEVLEKGSSSTNPEISQKTFFGLANLLKDFPEAQKSKLTVKQAELLMMAGYNMGETFQMQGAFKSAMDVFEALRKFAPRNPMTYIALGTLHDTMKDHKKANEHFVAALRISPSLLDARAKLVKNLMADPATRPEAIQVLYTGLSAHKFQPGSEELYFMLANLLEEYDRDVECIQVLKDLLSLQPQNSRARSTLGRVLSKKGDLASAEKELQKAVKMQPFDSSLQFHLGSLYLKKNDIEKAKLSLKEAIRLDDAVAQGMALKLMGKIMMKEEVWEEASRYFLRYAELQPFAPEGHLRAGVSLERSGKECEAIECFTRAMGAWELKAGNDLAGYFKKHPDEREALSKIGKRCEKGSKCPEFKSMNQKYVHMVSLLSK